MSNLRADAQAMLARALEDAKPGPAVRKAMEGLPVAKRYYLLSIGKAGWAMAEAACACLGDRLEEGLVITKYEHSQGPLPACRIFEAGHPVLDQNSLDATAEALTLADRLGEEDCLIFLISGGGSALFEHSDLDLEELQAINQALLSSGMDIVKMNTLRKRFSQVKGGQFAYRAAPAQIYALVLSDVLGDRLDSIASGPAYPDDTSKEEALAIVEDYQLELSDQALAMLHKDLPQKLDNVTTKIIGSVGGLISSAQEEAQKLGYQTIILSDRVDIEARDLGQFLGGLAQTQASLPGIAASKIAYILGGETVVTLKGKGKGGRNQEIALAAAPYLAGMDSCLLFSLGSDGTDGPTDAAGGWIDGESLAKLQAAGYEPAEVLKNNDAYHALAAIEGLIMTGPTGTNVNDLTCLLLG